jgi:hypothetical protein
MIKKTLQLITIVSLVFFARLIPHPPNFSTIIALTFYVSIFFGKRSLIILLISFILTDFVLGFYKGIYFTWGSIILIGLLAEKFKKNFTSRIFGSFFSVFLFFIISNLGIFVLNTHGIENNIYQTFVNALPFLINSLVSTMMLSLFVELIICLKKNSSINISS